MPDPAAGLISVVMTVFNAETYLALAIDSILAQTFTDFEFIIVNDGSTDGSLRIMDEYSRRDSRIRVVNRENAGMAVAANQGLSLSRGELIARMDADDVAMPDRFARQVVYLREHPGCVAVGTWVMLVDPDGDPIMQWNSFTSHDEIEREHLLGRGGAMCHPSVMIRRSALDRIGGYRTGYDPAEDYNLFLRLGEVGQLANVPEILLHYRQHPASSGHAQRTRQAQSAARSLREAHERRGLPPLAQADELDRERPQPHHLRWGWWALNHGNLATARKHARIACLRRPWSVGTWKLLACAWRGH